MKKDYLINLLFICALSVISSFSAFGQKVFVSDTVLPENRPFDFRDKYYGENGVEPSLIYQRMSGTDKFSVFDWIDDGIHRGVRIIGTFPAYNFEGKMIFWNEYGELFDISFKNDSTGKQAYELANRFPIFIFPSTTFKDSNRQAHLIDTSVGYFEKNPLGLGVEVLVEYTDKSTMAGESSIEELAKKNGISLDGTPIIRTTKELEDLTRRGLVTQKIKGVDDRSVPSYAIGPVIRDPKMGAISPDAFLIMVLKKNGKPLDAEAYILENFECLRENGAFCN